MPKDKLVFAQLVANVYHKMKLKISVYNTLQVLGIVWVSAMTY